MPKIKVIMIDTHEIIVTGFVDAVPREGESIVFPTLDIPFLWVSSVRHEFDVSNQSLLSHEVEIVVTPMGEQPLSVYIEWADPTQRPEWLDEEAKLFCDIAPRVGEFIELCPVIVTTDEVGFGFGDMIVAEVVRIAHAVMYDITKYPVAITSSGAQLGLVLRLVEEEHDIKHTRRFTIHLN